MAKSRKDNKGIVLKTGEGQRKDGIYYFRYTDKNGKRCEIYAGELQELRRKKEEILIGQLSGVDYAAGRISVNELVERCFKLKRGVSRQTELGYWYLLKPHRKSWLFRRQVGDVKFSDVKRWFIELNEAGYAYSTIAHIKSILNQAFKLAYEDDIILKNPCDFRLANTITNESKSKFAMTPEQQRRWLDFIKNDKTYVKYYDDYVILLETGLRISEFCGLTRKDIDFDQRRIRVDHQLLQDKHGYKIGKPKTEKGVRYVPMSDAAYNSLQKVLANRWQAKTDVIIDGYGGFLFLTSKGNPESKNSIERRTRRILAKYNEQNDEKLPNITPHIFRHTFCSNMANAGMNPNYLKYIMGHSKVTTTLDVYTHADFAGAARQMAELADLQNYQAACER